MRSTSSATLEFPKVTLVMLSFNLLFKRKPTHAIHIHIPMAICSMASNVRWTKLLALRGSLAEVILVMCRHVTTELYYIDSGFTEFAHNTFDSRNALIM